MGNVLPKAKPKEKVHRSFMYQCENGQQAVILDVAPGPLAEAREAFTYQGVRHHNGEVEWGIYRWDVNGRFIYGDEEPGWDLLLETCQDLTEG